MVSDDDLNNMRNMLGNWVSWGHIPGHAATQLEAALTELEQLRKERGQEIEKRGRTITKLASLRHAAAAHVAALGAYIDYKNLEHDDPCPEDDTCECEYVLAVDASLRRLASELEGKGT